MKLKNFEIAEEYLTSVNIEDEVSFDPVPGANDHLPREQREYLDSIAGKKFKCLRTIDHPEFTKLREQLGEEGYISIQRGWWNGDKVLKSFLFNGIKFLKDSRFPCASALGVSYKIAKENGRKTFSKY